MANDLDAVIKGDDESPIDLSVRSEKLAGSRYVASLDPDLAHILRAVMGLYLALGLFWIYAAFHDAWRNAAVVTTMVFCAGLVSGRFISLVIEGRPAPLLLLYVFMELALIPLGLWVLKQSD